MPRCGSTKKRIRGICWECHGLDIAYFDDPTTWLRRKVLTKYAGFWNDIRQDCAACDSLKNLLQVMISRRTEGVFHWNDLYVESVVENTGEGRCTPKYLKLRVVQLGVSRESLCVTPLEQVCLVSGSMVDQSDMTLHDLSLVKSWIDECQENHSECYGNTLPFAFPLKVIHCASRQLCFIEPGTPYVCLSYVWGRQMDMESDAPGIPECLPKTIEDALHVALQLNISYLWVDRYCIDQNDDSEKFHLIKKMDAVYRGATLTIVAASGQDPYCGLPGINGTPCREQIRHVAGAGAGLAVLHSLNPDVIHTIWSTRAWTYQELELSRRLLIFTEVQMYFQCPVIIGIPSLHTPRTVHSPLVSTTHYETERLEKSLEFYRARYEQSVTALFRRLITYFPKHLSHTEDVVKAFMGIFNALELHDHQIAIHATQIHGLPVLHSENLLDFRITPSGVRSGCLSSPTSTLAFSLGWLIMANWSWNEPATRSKLFPSWSWASVKANRHPQPVGGLEFPSRQSADVHQHEDIQAWVAFRDGDPMTIEKYVSGLKDYTGDELDQTLWIRSWVTVLDLAALLQCDTAVIKPDGTYIFAEHPDYPLYQPKGDLVAMHIGSLLDWHRTEVRRTGTGLLREFIPLNCAFLILEKYDNLTWRRVGVHFALAEDEFDGTTTVDKNDVPKARETLINIDMRGIWGVRKEWELRTLCLI
jgi:hypothetical protein